MHTFIFSLI